MSSGARGVMIEPFSVRFGPGKQALGIRIESTADLAEAATGLGLSLARPVLVLIGGAAGLEDEPRTMRRLSGLFRALARTVEETKAVVVDGGTDAGVMRLMGRARAGVGGIFPLVGVTAEGTVRLPTAQKRVAVIRECYAERAALEPNHTHFILVPGEQWGDESPWLAALAEVLAGSAPSLTLLVNGGEVSRQDVTRSLEAGRPVVVVAGTGRLADELASAAQRPPLLHVIDLAQGTQAVAAGVASLLKER